MGMMIYLLKANVLLAVFYGFYRLFFTGDTFFGWRRAVLLLLMAAAVVLPLADIGGWVESHQATANLQEVYREVMLPTVTVTGEVARFPWLRLFSSLYIIGVAALLGRMAWQLASIVRLLRTTPEGATMQGEPLWGEVSLHYLSDATCPFSFFRWIFVNPKAQTEEQLQEIMIHERTHVEQWHSLDILLTELLTAFCWMNPFVWLLRREVRLNLEFLADERVVAAGSERKAYQYHLLGLAYGKNVATISNNFNVLPLKLRIKMMNKKRTNSWLRAKYLLLVPVVGVALVACNLDKKSAEPATAEEQAAQSDSAAGKPVMVPVVVDETPAQDEGQAAESVVEGKVFDVVEQMPAFPGGMEKLMSFLQNNVKYPKQAQEKGTQGRVIVQFVVNTDGSIDKPKVVKSVDALLDNEALRVVKMMPKWQPGKQNGEAVRVKYVLPVTFRLQ